MVYSTRGASLNDARTLRTLRLGGRSLGENQLNHPSFDVPPSHLEKPSATMILSHAAPEKHHQSFNDDLVTHLPTADTMDDSCISLESRDSAFSSLTAEETTIASLSDSLDTSSVSHLRGWLNDFGKQQKKHFEQNALVGVAPADTPLEKPKRPRIPASASDVGPRAPLHGSASTLMKRIADQPKPSMPPRRNYVTPVRVKPKIKSSEVQATNEGYASVAKLSAWLADDPTKKNKMRHIRRGANVLNKSRVFDKGLENVIVEQHHIEKGHVGAKKQWLEQKQEAEDECVTSDWFEQRSASVRETSSVVSVNDKKEWLANAFKSNKTDVGTSEDREDLTARAKQLWRERSPTRQQRSPMRPINKRNVREAPYRAASYLHQRTFSEPTNLNFDSAKTVDGSRELQAPTWEAAEEEAKGRVVSSSGAAANGGNSTSPPEKTSTKATRDTSHLQATSKAGCQSVAEAARAVVEKASMLLAEKPVNPFSPIKEEDATASPMCSPENMIVTVGRSHGSAFDVVRSASENGETDIQQGSEAKEEAATGAKTSSDTRDENPAPSKGDAQHRNTERGDGGGVQAAAKAFTIHNNGQPSDQDAGGKAPAKASTSRFNSGRNWSVHRTASHSSFGQRKPPTQSMQMNVDMEVGSTCSKTVSRTQSQMPFGHSGRPIVNRTPSQMSLASVGYQKTTAAKLPPGPASVANVPVADDSSVGFHAARNMLVKRAKKNGSDMEILTKVNRRKAKFEQWSKEHQRRGAATIGAAPKKSISELP